MAEQLCQQKPEAMSEQRLQKTDILSPAHPHLCCSSNDGRKQGGARQPHRGQGVPVGLKDTLHTRHFWVCGIAVEGKAVADGARGRQCGSKAPGGELLVGVIMLQHSAHGSDSICIQAGRQQGR